MWGATLLLGWTVASHAEPLDPPGATNPVPEDDLWALLDNLPPRRSWDLALTVNYADVTYWRAYTPPWMAFGLRASYGTHLGESRNTRLAVGMSASTEGPIPEYYTLAFEPSFDVDYVDHGVQAGLSVGPAVLVHSRLTLLGDEFFYGLSPSVGARLGYSQPFSRVTRRMFVVADPKLRVVNGDLSWVVGVAIGSGMGK